MTTQSTFEAELAKHLVLALDLEITPETIVPDAPLFGHGTPGSLGLDSIDALEISLMIAQKYGVQIKADDEKNKAIFASLRRLAEHIRSLG